MLNVKTKEDFLKANLSDISQVYSGKRHHCRCGCGGDYISTTYMKNNRSDINDKLAEKRLKRAKKLVEQGADFDAGGTYFDVETGNNRCLTFYFDDLNE